MEQPHIGLLPGISAEPAPVKHVPSYSHTFDDITRGMEVTLAEQVARGGGKLFLADAPDIWDVYLHTFHADDRQYHDCRTCRTFLERFGGLVTLDQGGRMRSALFDETTLPYKHAYHNVVKALREYVEGLRVTDQFLSSQRMLGQRDVGGWTHFYAYLSAGFNIHSSRALTVEQAMAAKRQDRETLERAVRTFSLEHLKRAKSLMAAGRLARGDKFQPMVEFLIETKEAVARARGETRNRILWEAVGRAAAGWCSPRSSVVGALIDDLTAHMSLETVIERHAERVDPARYMRPTSSSAGNIRQAERVVHDLGIASSLRRRFAALDEVQLIWAPIPQPKAKAEGVFGHLQQPKRQLRTADLRGVTTLTFAKFQRDVLPNALRLEVLTPPRGSYCAYTTAVDPDAPPIIRWDSDSRRNPFAWYVYHNGSTPMQWGLPTATWVEVLGVSPMPPAWFLGDAPVPSHLRELCTTVLFVLKGAEDSAAPSLALFPELLRGDLHPVRSTIEAHSRSQRLDKLPVGRAYASGLRVGDNAPADVRATFAGDVVVRYRIDRWE